MEYKRVYATQDEDGHWYVIPYEMVDLFNELIGSFSLPDHVSSEMTDELYEKRQAMEDHFEETFSEYRTGGDLNLVELYQKVN